MLVFTFYFNHVLFLSQIYLFVYCNKMLIFAVWEILAKAVNGLLTLLV